MQLNVYKCMLESETNLRVAGMYLGQAHPSLLRGRLIELPNMDEELNLIVEDQISRGDALCRAVPGDDAPFILPSKRAVSSPDVARHCACARAMRALACAMACCVLVFFVAARDGGGHHAAPFSCLAETHRLSVERCSVHVSHLPPLPLAPARYGRTSPVAEWRPQQKHRSGADAAWKTRSRPATKRARARARIAWPSNSYRTT